MVSAGTAQAEGLVWAALRLNSVELIKETLRRAGDIDADALLGAIDALRTDALKANKNSEADLLSYLETLVNEVLNEIDWPAALAVIGPETEAIVRRALAETSMLSVLDLLKHHRTLMTSEVYQSVERGLFEGGPPKLGASRTKRVLSVVGTLAGGSSKARTHMTWASDYRRAGDLYKAQHHASLATRLAEESADAFTEVAALGLQGSLYERFGDRRRAADAFQAAFDQASKAGYDAVGRASIGEALARTYRGLGRYSAALEILEAVMKTRAGIGDHGSEMRNRLLKGLLLEDLGEFERGQAEYETIESIAKSARDLGRQFEAMTNIAASFLKRGDSREGIKRFRQVLVTVQGWQDPRGLASTRNNLGAALLEAGRPAEAMEEYRLAFLDKFSGDPRGMAISVQGLGRAARELGDEEAAKTWMSLLLMNYAETGENTILMAYLTELTDDEITADEGLERMISDAVTSARESGDALDELLLASRLAKYQKARGNRERAIALYRDGIARGTARDPAAPLVIGLKEALAKALMEETEGVSEAYEILESLIAQVRRQIDDLPLDVRKGELIAERIGVYGAMIDLLVSFGERIGLSREDAGRKAFELCESAKSRAFLARLAHASLSPPATISREVRDREARLLAVNRGLQDPTNREVPIESYRLTRLQEIERELNECWTQMRSAAPEYVRLRTGVPATADEVRAIITASGVPTAVVSFLCQQDHTTCFVLRSDSDGLLVHRLAVGREELSEAAKALRRAFNGSPDEFPPYPAIRRDRPNECDLSFLDTIAHRLLTFLPSVEGVELLCIAPHGPLHLLPLHALRTPQGGYLVERFGVAYTPSLTALGYTARVPPQRSSSDRTSVYVAGVSSDTDPHPENFERDAELFDRSTCDVVEDSGADAVSKDRVVVRASGHEVVHLTCHGHFDHRDPLSSGLLLSDGEQRPPRDVSALPITRRADFVLTARDVLRSNIDAQLITLRACSTGLQAELNPGDEFEGLTRSLLLAGGRSIIASLWNVDQQSSFDLLQRFYRIWRMGKGSQPKWRALAAAQREMLSCEEEPVLRHMYHWAPLVLIGDWR